MCGIVGYTGFRDAVQLLVQGLQKLEYRGYDSFGIATLSEAVMVHKSYGRISGFDSNDSTLSGTTGIGHTRWATHGKPCDENAHPHLDCKEQIAVVHNGIIENYSEIKRELIKKGHIFRSETDTEVIAHLLEENYEGDLVEAMQKVTPLLAGSYAILAMVAGEDRIVAARLQSPLAIGIGDDEYFAASDITPMLEYTERIIYLEDGDVAVITAKDCEIYNEKNVVKRQVHQVDWTPEEVQKGGFAHFMIKEIYEQPSVISRSVRSVTPVTLPKPLKNPKSISVVACGSSYNAGLIFKYLLEDVSEIPVRTELGSEFKYTNRSHSEVVIGISQSGETADTLAAIKKGKCHNCRTVAVTNVLNSSVTRIADYSCFMQAGPEISVAATKSFIAQIGVLMQIINLITGGKFDKVLAHANRAIEHTLLLEFDEAVSLCRDAAHMFYVARGAFYPVVMEGALKMKEISYIHAEAYAAGEIKHGPFSLLSEKTPVVAVCMPGRTYPVMLSNLKEMKARGTPILAIGTEDDTELSDIVDVLIPLPDVHEYLQIIMVSVVLQLLSYHVANALGRDIDKPRNLAKSVTVE